jgi:hypothetical protein
MHCVCLKGDIFYVRSNRHVVIISCFHHGMKLSPDNKTNKALSVHSKPLSEVVAIAIMHNCINH